MLRSLTAVAALSAALTAQIPCFQTNLGTNLGICDEQVTAGQPLGFAFTYGGNVYTDIQVSDNGFIILGQPLPAGTHFAYVVSDTAMNAAAYPSIRPLWCDLDPCSPGGDGVYFNAFPATPTTPAYVCVTWHKCHEYGGLQEHTFQLKLLDTGEVRCTWLTDLAGNTNPFLTGASTGNGALSNPVNLSALPVVTLGNPVFSDVGNGAPNWTGKSHTWLPDGTGGYNIVEDASCAAKSTYGVGCYDRPRMVFEQFSAGAPVDLVNTSWTFVFSGDSYIVLPIGPAYDATTPALAGVDLVTQTFTSSSSASWDDACMIQTLPVAQFPNGFPYPAAVPSTCTEITINSNARIYLGSTFDTSFAANGANYASLSPFQGTSGPGLPQHSPFNVDLDPSFAGQIWYEAPSPNGGVRITWVGVPNWAGGIATVNNDIQVEFLPNGDVTYAFGASLGTGGSAGNDAITGFSAGGGEPLSTMVDWSTLNGYITGNGDIAVTLDADATPVLGTTINMVTGNIPANTLLLATFYGFSQFDPGLPLGGLGLVGCQQYCSTDATNTAILPGSSYSQPFALPTSTAFAGFNLYAQSAALAPGTIPNALGVGTSNGVKLTININ